LAPWQLRLYINVKKSYNVWLSERKQLRIM